TDDHRQIGRVTRIGLQNTLAGTLQAQPGYTHMVALDLKYVVVFARIVAIHWFARVVAMQQRTRKYEPSGTAYGNAAGDEEIMNVEALVNPVITALVRRGGSTEDKCVVTEFDGR